MESKGLSSRLWAEIGFAVFILLSCGALLLTAIRLPTMSALLPVAMLLSLMALAGGLCLSLYIRRVVLPTKPGAFALLPVLASFATIVAYTLAVQFVGFYTSTIIMVPLVAWAFGYRKLFGLVLSTVIFVGGIYVIFSLLMGQRFPQEFFLI